MVELGAATPISPGGRYYRDLPEQPAVRGPPPRAPVNPYGEGSSSAVARSSAPFVYCRTDEEERAAIAAAKRASAAAAADYRRREQEEIERQMAIHRRREVEEREAREGGRRRGGRLRRGRGGVDREVGQPVGAPASAPELDILDLGLGRPSPRIFRFYFTFVCIN